LRRGCPGLRAPDSDAPGSKHCARRKRDHGRVKESLEIAVLASFDGIMLSRPIGLLAARNLMPARVQRPAHSVIARAHAFHSVIVAIVFVKAIAGALALLVASIGLIGKRFAKAVRRGDRGDPAQAGRGRARDRLGRPADRRPPVAGAKRQRGSAHHAGRVQTGPFAAGRRRAPASPGRARGVDFRPCFEERCDAARLAPGPPGSKRPTGPPLSAALDSGGVCNGAREPC